jgi:hypothetical protein
VVGIARESLISVSSGRARGGLIFFLQAVCLARLRHACRTAWTAGRRLFMRAAAGCVVIHRVAPNHPAVFRPDVPSEAIWFLCLIDRPAPIDFFFRFSSDGPDATSNPA